MKSKITLIIFSLLTILFASCTKKSDITLFGEIHYIKEIHDKELELYRDFYEKGGRHLFIEQGYSYAEIMNLIMKYYDSFEVFLSKDRLEDDFYFYQYIKDNFPETIFHGIDVEKTNCAEILLEQFQKNNLGTEEELKLINESIEESKIFRSFNVEAEKVGFREKCMTKNFIREYNKLKGEPIFGIFGSAHTNKTDMYMPEIPTMGMNIIKEGINYEEIRVEGIQTVMRNGQKETIIFMNK